MWRVARQLRERGVLGLNARNARYVLAYNHRRLYPIVDEHPDTDRPIAGLSIPHWAKMLEIAARGFELSGLGYLGVDLVLDRDLGPLILELNARPGLNIQLANRQGLRPRLERIEAEGDPGASVGDRVAFARQHFGRGAC